MAARKRPLMSSVQGSQIQAAALARQMPPPPMELNDEELESYQQIITAREAALGFNEYELVMVCQLAKNTVLLNELTERLKTEGPTIAGGRNGTTPVINPIFTARDSCARTAFTLTRLLGLTAPVTPEQRQRNQADTKARHALEKAAELSDDLI